MKARYDGGVAPANSMDSGDDGGGSSGKESEREMEASSGRKDGREEELDFIGSRRERGRGGRGSSWGVGVLQGGH